ncbi:YbaB/EbfC family nucleoid-associated protein [Amycolatopsis taiwanensis]|uniref:YbaB/EbfC DNA-binding family protein n=1 Tax=Amycolatopsis taiwanensis TaxID=342230 RepID=A0A9W6VHS0_9PSEU|nr:YbaB/EbfC family nucleoid-associated protein [Amycolatopsis taiwanensis]GLY66741.1 hypothetical protein Atai01_33600 [Amycolatopsis taiwanensis]
MSEPFSAGLSGLNADPDEVERRIGQWAAGFAAKAERYEAAQARVEQLRSSATSPDGAVRVTVRSDGSLTDVQFTERIRALPLAELSAAILTTMRSAQAKVVEQVGETMSEELGDEDAQTRAVMMDQLRARFPEPDGDAGEEPVSDKWDYDRQEPPPRPPVPPAAQPPAPPVPPAPPFQPPAPPSPPAQPPAPPRRRPRPGSGHDSDDGFDDDFDPLRD